MSRKQSIARSETARSQSGSGPPVMETVKVAVMPPRLPKGMAPPTRLGAADTFAWDESINWQHNDDIDEKEPGRRKSFLRKVGLTTQRKRVNDDIPPFMMREVPYDTWRKHYAKDKNGFYHGTHAPAEDCILRPEDVDKWRLDDVKTKADRWTRGSEALPVYAEAREHGPAPDYDHDDAFGQGEPMLELPPDATGAAEPQRSRSTIADGKTAQEIIQEAKEKEAARKKLGKKEGLKKMLNDGINMTMGA